MSKSALKNKDIGLKYFTPKATLNKLLEQWEKVTNLLTKDSKYKRIFVLYCRIHLLRELIRKFFYGSVISDIVDFG